MTCVDHQTEKERLGYLAWHDKAHESHRKGMRQKQCTECRRWYFAWEMRP